MSDIRDDWAIVREVLDGDVNEFARLIERYQSMVLALVSSRVPEDQAAEVAHTAFIRVYGALKGYRPKAPFGNWVTTIVLRTCHDFWRKRYRAREVAVSDLSDSGKEWIEAALTAESDDEFFKMAEKREALETLDRLLASLSPLDRDIVTCIYLEGHSVRETAEMLDISTANVKVRAFRARRKMRQKFNRYVGGDNHA